MMYKIKAWAVLLLLCASCFLISTLPIIKTFSISPLVICIVVGAFYSNTCTKSYLSIKRSNILSFATKEILRLGVVLFGFHITIQEVSTVGISGIFLSFIVVFSAFFVGSFLGKLCGLDAKTAALVSVGSSVCGAAAIMACEDVIKGGSQKVAIAVCTVVVFGTMGMFLYPFLYKFIGFDQFQMGLLTGTSLHEVAHVVASGSAMDEDVQKVAVIAKMLRVIMLVPLLIVLSFLKFDNSKNGAFNVLKTFPYFAVCFLLVIFINSFISLPKSITDMIYLFDTFLLCIAMCALGMGIKKDSLKNFGLRPFVMAFFLFIFLFSLSYFFIKFII